MGPERRGWSTHREGCRGVEVVGQHGSHRGNRGLRLRAEVDRQGLPPPVQTRLRGLEEVWGVLPVVAVVLRQQDEADGHRVDPVGSQPRDEHQVALGLAHLLALEADHGLVHVVVGEDVVVGERGGLHRTHLVVREDEVGAAALDVERVPEPVSGDRRALDVPARSPGTEHLVLPRRLPVTHGAPQERVERVALAHPVGVATAIGEDGHHLLPGPARDRPERRGLGQVEVDVLAGTLGDRDRQPVCRAA